MTPKLARWWLKGVGTAPTKSRDLLITCSCFDKSKTLLLCSLFYLLGLCDFKYQPFCFKRCNRNSHFIRAYRNSWTLDAIVWRWTLYTGLCTLDCRHWTLDTGLWTLDSGLWTLDSGRYTQEGKLWALDAVFDWFRTKSEPSFWVCLFYREYRF